MNDSFRGLLFGLAGAVVLVYLLIVVNFQSWLDPFIIITALPAALAGIVWMLFLTHTTVSVPALTGAIMCMGVATANSVLMVSFARERMDAGDDAFKAASAAGFARFRPVLMTALAMIIGMIPMALSLGEGAEQNAPLGRAVIGGLVFATVATLFFVPTVFVLIHGRKGHEREPEPAPAALTDSSAPRPLRAHPARGRARPGGLGRGESRSFPQRARQGNRRPGRPGRHCPEAGREPAIRGTGAAGQRPGLRGGPDLRTHQRLSEKLVHGYRRSGEEGPLMAEIDTPEVDQQLRQARADLATAKANSDLARITDVRWKGLLANQAVSQQDADTRAGQAAASGAQAASAQANVARLEELESFKRIVAPFDGVVTARNTDIGALIAAGQTSGIALFRVADTQKLRVYVDVPEPYAPKTQPGIEVQLRFNEHPGKDFPAKLVRTAGALDPAVRTLRVELQVDNSKGELFPGAYAEAHFKLPGSATSYRVPATALIFRSKGLQIATVGADNKAHLRSVSAGSRLRHLRGGPCQV